MVAGQFSTVSLISLKRWQFSGAITTSADRRPTSSALTIFHFAGEPMNLGVQLGGLDSGRQLRILRRIDALIGRQVGSRCTDHGVA